MRMREIRLKEVINTCTCKKLGYISDLDVNLCTGRIEAILVPKSTGVCNLLGSDICYLIPYECIKKIGENLVFVEICEEDCVTTYRKGLLN